MNTIGKVTALTSYTPLFFYRNKVFSYTRALHITMLDSDVYELICIVLASLKPLLYWVFLDNKWVQWPNCDAWRTRKGGQQKIGEDWEAKEGELRDENGGTMKGK